MAINCVGLVTGVGVDGTPTINITMNCTVTDGTYTESGNVYALMPGGILTPTLIQAAIFAAVKTWVDGFHGWNIGYSHIFLPLYGAGSLI